MGYLLPFRLEAQIVSLFTAEHAEIAEREKEKVGK